MQWFKNGLCAGDDWQSKPLTRFSDWNWVRTRSKTTPEGCECCYKIRMVFLPFIYGLSLGCAFLISTIGGFFYFFGTTFVLSLITGIKK